MHATVQKHSYFHILEVKHAKAATPQNTRENAIKYKIG